MVKQASRCGNEDVCAPVDHSLLLFEANTSDEQGFIELHIFGVGVKVFSNLRRQLTCGAEHKAARHTSASAPTGKHRDHRQRE